jgi:twitching motility protein PilU
LSLPEVLSELIMEKRGLILIVGATGSGKSTTIASMLDYRNANRSGHILTIEDPIEFLFKHKKSIVNQRELGMDTLGWEAALKNAMRQAPDCILIGEIRDKETMQAAIAYAQTGHLCLATLHANNSYHALNRIINFFPLENRTSLYLDLSVSIEGHRFATPGQASPDGKRMPLRSHAQHPPYPGTDRAWRSPADQGGHGTESGARDRRPSSRICSVSIARATITLDEALANADSPTNLSWLINNSELTVDRTNSSADSPLEFGSDNRDNGTSFKEFTLSLRCRRKRRRSKRCPVTQRSALPSS